jgi:hypothetical protein
MKFFFRIFIEIAFSLFIYLIIRYVNKHFKKNNNESNLASKLISKADKQSLIRMVGQLRKNEINIKLVADNRKIENEKELSNRISPIEFKILSCLAMISKNNPYIFNNAPAYFNGVDMQILYEIGHDFSVHQHHNNTHTKPIYLTLFEIEKIKIICNDLVLLKLNITEELNSIKTI